MRYTIAILSVILVAGFTLIRNSNKQLEIYGVGHAARRKRIYVYFFIFEINYYTDISYVYLFVLAFIYSQQKIVLDFCQRWSKRWSKRRQTGAGLTRGHCSVLLNVNCVTTFTLRSIKHDLHSNASFCFQIKVSYYVVYMVINIQ